MTFQQELERLINKHSCEHGCANTPDFILAKYIMDCLAAWTRSVRAREDWYGFTMEPGLPDVIQSRTAAGKNAESTG